MSFQHIIEFTPAWDKRDRDPRKDFGIGSVEILFFVVFQKRAIELRIMTNWYLPQTEERMFVQRLAFCRPHAGDLAYHSPVPMYEGQSAAGSLTLDTEHPTIIEGEIVAPASFVHHPDKFTECRFTGGRCYMDGSFQRANRAFQILISQGTDGIWEFLEHEFRDRFKCSCAHSIEEHHWLDELVFVCEHPECCCTNY